MTSETAPESQTPETQQGPTQIPLTDEHLNNIRTRAAELFTRFSGSPSQEESNKEKPNSNWVWQEGLISTTQEQDEKSVRALLKSISPYPLGAFAWIKLEKGATISPTKIAGLACASYLCYRLSITINATTREAAWNANKIGSKLSPVNRIMWAGLGPTGRNIHKARQSLDQSITEQETLTWLLTTEILDMSGEDISKTNAMRAMGQITRQDKISGESYAHNFKKLIKSGEEEKAKAGQEPNATELMYYGLSNHLTLNGMWEREKGDLSLESVSLKLLRLPYDFEFNHVLRDVEIDMGEQINVTAHIGRNSESHIIKLTPESNIEAELSSFQCEPIAYTKLYAAMASFWLSPIQIPEAVNTSEIDAASSANAASSETTLSPNTTTMTPNQTITERLT